MADDKNNIDDDFLADLQSDNSADADPFTTDGSVSADPFASLDDLSGGSDPFGESSDPFAASDSASDADPFASSAEPVVEEAVAAAAVPVEETTGKKGKKAKKEKAPKAPKAEKVKKEKAPKAKKEKAPKAAKVKKAKAPKHEYYGSTAPYIVLFVVLLLALLAANAAAFMVAGASCATYLIVLDVLGLIILMIPFMLMSSLRQRPVGVFDFFLALAAILSVVSTIVIVTEQAKDFGASSKVSVVAPAASLDQTLETLDC